MRHFLIVALVCGCVFTVAQAQTEEFAATLRVLAPNVTYQRTNTSELLFVSQETIVGSGDTIQTRHSGRARLVLFGDGSRIDIEPDTTLIINTLENDEDNFTVRLTLLNGETRHRVLRTAGDDSIYEVQTDTGTITGSAGEFLVIQRDEQVTFLATVGDLTISHGDEETTSVPEGQGGRITPDGIVSDIVPAGSLDVLAPLLDGCPGEIIPIENRLLPVYLAPDAESLPLGTVNPYEVESISGSVIDRSWFRVPYNRSGGWVPAEQIEFVDTVGCAALRVYADDTIEDPQAFASEPDTLPWEYCTGNRPPPESWVRYEIRRGQTLFELAQRTSGTVEQIALVNCIADVRAVAAGRSVFLPSAP